MDMGLRMHVKHVTQERYWHQTWPHVDRDRWPGRELWWLWRHPCLGFILISMSLTVDVLAVIDIWGRID